MNDRLLIGKANFSQKGGFGGGKKWFYIKDNEENVYRVLPPLKSLAATGKVAQWQAVHRNLKDSNNKQKAFLCLEKKNKEGFITRHCPLCDRVRDLEEQLKTAKNSGATPEQLKQYRTQYIFPLQAEKRFYLNVVNQEGQIGVLSVTYSMYTSFEGLAKQWEQKGYDIAGMQGIFINFKKLTKYKGDRDAVHQAEVYMQPAQDGSFRFVTHEITAELEGKLRTDAADLAQLFKELTPEQAATIVSLEGNDRAEALSSYFNASEKVEAEEAVEVGHNAFAAPIPNTNMAAVARVEATPTGVNLQAPTLPRDFNPTPNNNSNSWPQAAKTAQPQQVAAAKTTLSDEEFLAITKPAR